MKKLGGWRRAGPMDLKFRIKNLKFKNKKLDKELKEMKKKMKKLGGWRQAGPMDLKFRFKNFKFKIKNWTNN